MNKDLFLILRTAIVVWGLSTLYLAIRYRDVRKFLARRSSSAGEFNCIYTSRRCRYRCWAQTSSLPGDQRYSLRSSFHFLLPLLVLRLYQEAKSTAFGCRFGFAIKAWVPSTIPLDCDRRRFSPSWAFLVHLYAAATRARRRLR